MWYDTTSGPEALLRARLEGWRAQHGGAEPPPRIVEEYSALRAGWRAQIESFAWRAASELRDIRYAALTAEQVADDLNAPRAPEMRSLWADLICGRILPNGKRQDSVPGAPHVATAADLRAIMGRN